MASVSQIRGDSYVSENTHIQARHVFSLSQPGRLLLLLLLPAARFVLALYISAVGIYTHTVSLMFVSDSPICKEV